jgi:septal ring factor EnvC (AmiA/AmiB activator)
VVDATVANVAATVAAPIVAASLAFVFGRVSKHGDARARAESALIGIAPDIIEAQEARVRRLTEEVERLWDRIRVDAEHRTRLQEQLNETGERERACLRRVTELERRLNDHEKRERDD